MITVAGGGQLIPKKKEEALLKYTASQSEWPNSCGCCNLTQTLRILPQKTHKKPKQNTPHTPAPTNQQKINNLRNKMNKLSFCPEAWYRESHNLIYKYELVIYNTFFVIIKILYFVTWSGIWQYESFIHNLIYWSTGVLLFGFLAWPNVPK